MMDQRPLIILGDGKGGFTEAGISLAAGKNPNYAALADLDHDGRLDVVTGNYGSGDVSVFLSRGGAARR